MHVYHLSSAWIFFLNKWKIPYNERNVFYKCHLWNNETWAQINFSHTFQHNIYIINRAHFLKNQYFSKVTAVLSVEHRKCTHSSADKPPPPLKKKRCPRYDTKLPSNDEAWVLEYIFIAMTLSSTLTWNGSTC